MPPPYRAHIAFVYRPGYLNLLVLLVQDGLGLAIALVLENQRRRQLG